MNRHTRHHRDTRRCGPILAAAMATALLAAACSGSSPPHPAGSQRYQQALTFAQCMRAHGAPNWPDPTSAGTFPTTPATASTGQAVHACHSLLTFGGEIPGTLAQQQQQLGQALKIAACIRAHGITSWPDPTPQDLHGPTGHVIFNLAGTSVDPGSPATQAATRACSSQLHTGISTTG